MPLYEYRCLTCRETTEAMRSVADRDNAPACDHCGEVTRKIISLNGKVHPDFEPYYDDNLETDVKSKQHRKKVMQEKGVVEAYGKGWGSW
jgi:putative FmdB family regulatory protein